MAPTIMGFFQLGRYMEAIVVDTESTARQCIQYLKDQVRIVRLR